MASTRTKLDEIVASLLHPRGSPLSHQSTASPAQHSGHRRVGRLQKIDVRGVVVTIDAMGAQKAIAEEVIRGQA
jgi:hypothetical protein